MTKADSGERLTLSPVNNAQYTYRIVDPVGESIYERPVEARQRTHDQSSFLLLISLTDAWKVSPLGLVFHGPCSRVGSLRADYLGRFLSAGSVKGRGRKGSKGATIVIKLPRCGSKGAQGWRRGDRTDSSWAVSTMTLIDNARKEGHSSDLKAGFVPSLAALINNHRCGSLTLSSSGLKQDWQLLWLLFPLILTKRKTRIEHQGQLHRASSETKEKDR
ncbi:cyclic pyranopterin monophosphate synthaseaccessory protein [Striga asiatica]|uniref:Cyclic pyranopterin monophosphate synthaseaccessory protein n=1 Tax=Striga asiatica TaxID=4170 RepID=A0A5A7QLL5_STRAF|nr:cyclic pyranopterin monophosphate synthaseaccessory protein [Striga asiatica]